MKAKRLTYAERYSDNSGIEFSVEYVKEPYFHDPRISGVINLHHVDTITFPVTKLDWLIDCLSRVKQELSGGTT